MDVRVKNTILAVGIVAGLASLPMNWMTIHNPRLNGPFGEAFGGLNMTLSATAFTGYVTLGVKARLWVVVAVAIGANLLQLMANSRAFAIPKVVSWGAALFALAWMLIPMCAALSSGRMTAGPGWFLGIVCAAIPLICLILPSAKSQDGVSSSKLN